MFFKKFEKNAIQVLALTLLILKYNYVFNKHHQMFEKYRLAGLFIDRLFWGGGRNVDDQNVDRPKISECRNGLFS